jgi:hypothetical protein
MTFCVINYLRKLYKFNICKIYSMISYKISRKKTNPKLEIPFVTNILGIKKNSSDNLLINIEETNKNSAITNTEKVWQTQPKKK